MIIHKALVQGSPEWHDFRRAHKMASETGAIFGCDPYKDAHEVSIYKLEGTQKAASPFLQKAADRGHRLEPVARKLVEKKYGEIFKPAVVEGEDLLAASLDGMATDMQGEITIITEIKCPIKGFEGSRAVGVPEGILEERDTLQVQHQLLVSGASMCVFAIYDEEKNDIITTEISPDAHVQANIVNAWSDFWTESIDKGVPVPERHSYSEREDSVWMDAAKEYLLANIDKKAAETKLAKAKKRLIALADGEEITGAGVKLTNAYRNGSVDYKKIPELKGVDLNAFRKAGTYYVTINKLPVADAVADALLGEGGNDGKSN